MTIFLIITVVFASVCFLATSVYLFWCMKLLEGLVKEIRAITATYFPYGMEVKADPPGGKVEIKEEWNEERPGQY